MPDTPASVVRGDLSDFGSFGTLVDQIDENAEAHPTAVAIKCSNGQSLTYASMMGRVQEICHHLLQNGCTPGSYVAVFCLASPDLACSLLAIMRMGAVYIPLDLRNPVARLSAMVEDCKPGLVLYHNGTADQISNLEGPGVRINISDAPAASNEPVMNRSSRDALAFIMYTSGSTGVPKGILLTQSNFYHQMNAVVTHLGLKNETVLQQSCWGFDVSLFQTFCALITAGTLIIVENDIRSDPEQLAQLMLRERVTFTLGVPSEYSSLLQYGQDCLSNCLSWRSAVCGGERMTVHLKNQFRALKLPSMRLINCYGPTEVSLAVTYGEVKLDREGSDVNSNISIGKVMPNYSVYIVDEAFQTVAVGSPGEIVVGGAGVGLGYTQAGAKSERFCTDPFAQEEHLRRGWHRAFRTGDRGYLTPSGDLHFLGRIAGSTQVKLRGNRIELDELENVILREAKRTLSSAAACLQGDECQRLVVFVVFANRHTPENPQDYLGSLRQRLPLPQHMRPAFITAVKHLPVTANGKLDRHALSKLNLFHHHEAAEENMAQVILKDVWESVFSDVGLSVQVDRNSDFFELGGNSLLLPVLRASIRKAFRTDVSVVDLFRTSLLRDMAELLDGFPVSSRLNLIDWDEEIDIALRTVRPPKEPARVNDNSCGIHVLLTGATGFFGGELLRRLIALPCVARIDCLAVRPRHLDRKRKSSDPYSHGKVRLHAGDLTQPLLGLSEAEAAILAAQASVIVHNGADVSFFKTYHSLRAANLFATAQLLRLSLPKRIPFHYISSAGIARFLCKAGAAASPSNMVKQQQQQLFVGSEIESANGNGPAPRAAAAAVMATDLGAPTFREESLSEYSPPRDGTDGYVASKWASEQLVAVFAREHGDVRTFVHRPTSIVGPGAPPTDLVDNLLRYCRKLRAVPDFAAWDRHALLDCVPLEEAAGGVVDSLLQSVRRNEINGSGVDAPTFVHHCARTKIPIHSLGAFLGTVGSDVGGRSSCDDNLKMEKTLMINNDQEGGPEGAEHCTKFLPALPMAEWLRRAQSRGLDQTMTLLFEFLEETRGSNLVVPLVVKRGQSQHLFGGESGGISGEARGDGVENGVST